MSFASCSLFSPMVHLLQPDWCSQDAAHSKLLCCSAPSPLGCSLGEPLWTSLTLHHCGMRKLPETLEKDLQERKLFLCFWWLLVRSSLCGTAPFPLVESQICSHCSPEPGWSGVLSQRLEVISLGSWFIFPVCSLTMWWCWEIMNALPSEPQVELVVLVNAQKRLIFQVLSWLPVHQCKTIKAFGLGLSLPCKTDIFPASVLDTYAMRTFSPYFVFLSGWVL